MDNALAFEKWQSSFFKPTTKVKRTPVENESAEILK
jgi:hypothetical protein